LIRIIGVLHLQCIGGICRFVSENAGFSMQLNYSF